MGIKHIHGSATSLNGCKVDIDGDVHYSLIPLQIIGFHGSVHLDGEKGGPTGDLYFGIELNGSTPILEFGERKPLVKQNSTGECYSYQDTFCRFLFLPNIFSSANSIQNRIVKSAQSFLRKERE